MCLDVSFFIFFVFILTIQDPSPVEGGRGGEV